MMSARKPERAMIGKCRDMTDEELRSLNSTLKREIPAAQSMHSAVRRELRRRRAAARRASA